MKVGNRGIIALAFVLVLALGPASGQTLWNNTGTGDWFTASNWNPATLPGSTTEVDIDGGTASVTATGAQSGQLWIGKTANGSLSITQGGTFSNSSYIQTALGYQAGVTGTVLVDGAGSTWTDSSYYPTYVGYSGTGSLTIQNGGAVSLTAGDMYAGFQPGGSGSITVTGGSLTFNTATYGTLYVGSTGNQGYADSGSGTLLVQGGGTVHAYGVAIGAHGSATVTGAGSSVTTSSNFAVATGGSLLIEDGATVNMSSGGGSNGTTTVDGVGTQLIVGEGYNAYGAMTVRNGATVTSGQLSIDGSMTITGSGSAWSASDGVWASGSSTSGSLSILSGGSLASGYDSFLDGLALTVDGTNSTWSGSGHDIYVAESYSGTVAVQNAGQIVTHGIYLCSGSLSVDGTGSAVAASDTIDLGWMQSSFNNTPATMQVTNGGAVSDSIGLVGDHNAAVATVDGAGSAWSNSTSLTLGSSASGTLIVQNGGTVSVGGGTGTVTVKSHGLLQIGNGGEAGTVSAATVSLATGAQLAFDHNSSSYTFAPVVTGSGSIVHQGTGTTILSGNSNAFTGTTSVNAGTLLVKGTLGGSGSSVTIASGGTLGGSGTLGGAMTLQAGGTLAPGGDGGDSSLAGTSLAWNGGGQLNFSLGTTQSLLTLSGALTKGTAGTFLIGLGAVSGLVTGSYTLATFGSTTFTASDFSLASTGSGIAGTFSLTSTALNFNVTAVPEPGSIALLAASGLALAAWRRRGRAA